MSKKNWILNWYSYLIPTLICILYFIYVFLILSKTISLPWIGDSKGFYEMCKSIAEFSTVILGIYGFFIPIVIGKEDSLSRYYWKHIDRERFSKDMHRLVFSGLLTIILSSVLLIADIMNKVAVMVLFGILLWSVLFYLANTFRFIGIFIELILAKTVTTDDKGNKTVLVDEVTKRKLDSKIEKF